MDERDLLIGLNTSRVQRAALCRLAAETATWKDARNSELQRLAGSIGLPLKQLRRAVEAARDAARTADREHRRAEAAGCRLITRLDDDYPTELLDHPLPPPVLYCRGDLPKTPAMAMVGARRLDAYGREAARLFARTLARAGVTVVSGFAVGIDATAHRAALDAGGSTVAVLGCGLDVDYPKGSRPLADAVARRGALISEWPLGTEPRAWHFPIRNRVIAALGTGTLVVQAKLRSGSLITAHQALELGRDVYAVPGRIFDELALGTNGLLADGAVLVQSPEDLLDHLALGFQRELFPGIEDPPRLRRVEAPRPQGLAGRVLDALPAGGSGLTAEDIASEVGQGVDRVLGPLLELELAGWLERRPGPVYCR